MTEEQKKERAELAEVIKGLPEEKAQVAIAYIRYLLFARDSEIDQAETQKHMERLAAECKAKNDYTQLISYINSFVKA